MGFGNGSGYITYCTTTSTSSSANGNAKVLFHLCWVLKDVFFQVKLSKHQSIDEICTPNQLMSDEANESDDT